MLSKEIFCKAINEIIKYNKAIDKLNDVNSTLASAIVCDYSLQDAMINVLVDAMGLKTDERYRFNTLSWWVYDAKFGKNDPIVWVDNNGSYDKIVLDTPEKLYYFCVKEVEKK